MQSGTFIECLFVHDKTSSHPLIELLKAKKIPRYTVSDGILKKITDTAYLIPLVGVAKLPNEILSTDLKEHLVVVLDNLQDHGNIGTIIRTAAAFGIHEIVLTDNNSDLFYKKNHRRIAGSALWN